MTKTRRSPKEVIERISQPELEEAWYQLRGRNFKPGSRIRGRTVIQHKPVFSLGRKYRGIHTHPSCDEIHKYPSLSDITNLLTSPDERSSVISQTNPDTGELIGYFVMRKARKNYNRHFLGRLFESVRYYGFLDRNHNRILCRKEALDKVLKNIFLEEDIKWRYVPNKYYQGYQE